MNRERLLNVAKALRESPNPEKFSMNWYGECGTPQCAFGHYANRADLQQVFCLTDNGYVRLLADDGRRLIVQIDDQHVLTHFGISLDQTYELFGDTPIDWNDEDGEEPRGWGCDSATTAIEAAQYIEDFVARGGK